MRIVQFQVCLWPKRFECHTGDNEMFCRTDRSTNTGVKLVSICVICTKKKALEIVTEISPFICEHCWYVCPDSFVYVCIIELSSTLTILFPTCPGVPSDIVTQPVSSTTLVASHSPELLFSKWAKICFGYFNPQKVFLGIENDKYSGWANR